MIADLVVQVPTFYHLIHYPWKDNHNLKKVNQLLLIFLLNRNMKHWLCVYFTQCIDLQVCTGVKRMTMWV